MTINGKVITELGITADLFKDHIKVNNKLITRFETPRYILLNKPKGFITTCNDPESRPTVMSLLKNITASVKPVGRLDYNTDGLLLLTNDGEMANRLTHPTYKIEKTYVVTVRGTPSLNSLERLRKGVFIDKKKTMPAKVDIVEERAKKCLIQITIAEGKNLQIKKMFGVISHHVVKLKRTKYGFLTLKNLKLGEHRDLTEKEVEKLKVVCKLI